jgi:hypothetical protein
MVEKVLTKLEESSVSSGNQGDLGWSGKQGGGVGHGLLQDYLLKRGQPGTASVEEGTVQHW